MRFANYPNYYAWKKILLACAVLAIILISWQFIKQKKIVPDNPNKMVEIEIIKPQNIQQRIHLLGVIHPKHTTLLIAKGSGTLDAFVATGQKVKKGTLLARIDNSDIEKNAQLSQSAEQLAREQYERFIPLTKKGFVSPKEIEERKQAWINAQKEYAKAKIELDYMRFYAPFDGIVGAYKKREGSQVTQGDPVVSVYDPASLVVDFDIPCGNLAALSEGQKVYVFGKQYRLTHLQKMLDEDTHMCPADVDIQCPDCLIGTTAKISLVVMEKKNTIVIPLQALFLRDGRPVVYIVKNNKVELLAVKTGIRQADKIEILEGLNAGQQLIIKGQDRLYPKMTVDIYTPTAKIN
ncbi:efflux RND transporter periplasmic adaptor subunit [Legionella sp. km772]|uniref:efflux RND transporter periplasmic adaptor subunit n=1 Tax=Legionella sp. km772 TaxID=2498111 RepID=UPI000F8DE92C|nr:efflux RND transporter periplasmic adaptor subunit [Legionella sp. km772]RUR12952.1 efflux RND transporter periplasmic adaptor subunit [Legionella sp. km772]